MRARNYDNSCGSLGVRSRMQGCGRDLRGDGAQSAGTTRSCWFALHSGKIRCGKESASQTIHAVAFMAVPWQQGKDASQKTIPKDDQSKCSHRRHPVEPPHWGRVADQEKDQISQTKLNREGS